MSKKSSKELVTAARQLLESYWQSICQTAEVGDLKDVLEDVALRQMIRESVRSKTKTYRYVLPTQILAKAVDASVDVRSLQVHKGKEGAFDARSVAHEVVVPFDQQNHRVLGGSAEPYVSNPLRVPAVMRKHSDAQRNKVGWGYLCQVLDAVEKHADPTFTRLVLNQVLIEVYRQLGEVQVSYPVPLRVSVRNALWLIEHFLSAQSGGDRTQAVACALFELIGRKFGLYEKVNRGLVNAADAATGLVADLECVTAKGEVALAVEVKDKELTIAHIEQKLQSARAKKVSEILFVAQRGFARNDQDRFVQFAENEFARGQSVYVFQLEFLARVVLALVGTAARSDFLRLVARQLDEYRSDIRHRRAWRDLLAKA